MPNAVRFGLQYGTGLIKEYKGDILSILLYIIYNIISILYTYNYLINVY